jgi:hypothetical protein
MPSVCNANDDPSPVAGILRCRACRKTIECELIDLLHFSKQSWPQCCGESMTLYTAAEKSAVGKSASDTQVY